jgi:hypothetical protein
MPRLRTLPVTETGENGRARSRDILILDGLNLDQVDGMNLPNLDLRERGIPPILAFAFDVDLPQSENDPDEQVFDINIDTTTDPGQVADQVAAALNRAAKTHRRARF